jgi:hypothetical protein
MVSNRRPFSFNFIFGNRKKSQGAKSGGVRWVGNDSHFVFLQKLLGKDGSVRRGVVMVKQPGLFSPKFGATSSHVFTQSPQNLAVEPGIHSLVCWDKFFVLPQLLYRWRHQSGIFWIPPRMLAMLRGETGKSWIKNELTFWIRKGHLFHYRDGTL